MICTPFTGHLVEGVFLCVTAMNLRKSVLKCIGLVSDKKHQRDVSSKDSEKQFVNGFVCKMQMVRKF